MAMPPQQQKNCKHECVCHVYRSAYLWAGSDITYCGYEHCIHDTRLQHTLRITDTHTGKTYTADLQQLCIDAGLSDRLTYCDIECLLTDGETWYMLDECGNWAYLPAWYKVEEVR